MLSNPSGPPSQTRMRYPRTPLSRSHTGEALSLVNLGRNALWLWVLHRPLRDGRLLAEELVNLCQNLARLRQRG